MISEIAPRGKPLMSWSSEARPVDSVSRIRASGRNPSVVGRAALGFMQIRLFFAIRIVARPRLDVKGDHNSLSILSIMDKRVISMRYVSATDAKQRLAALLDAAQREPVIIRRQKRDVAVILSPQEYDRLRALNIAELQRLCDRVAKKAAARGLTKEKLDSLLADE